MARRRTNHGLSRPAGELADHAIRAIVPPDRLRLTRVQLAWPSIAKGPLARVAWPGTLRGASLLLFVRDAQWQHELSYMKAELLERLRAVCPSVPLAEVRLRVGEIPEPVPEPPPLPATPVVDLPLQPEAGTLAALHRVADDDLRNAIATARMALSGQLRR